MISRTWHGAVPMEMKDSFADYLEKTGVKDTLATRGNLGAYVTECDQTELAHFFLCTIWVDMQSVMAYAGETPEIAVTYPDDARYGLISDPIVIHQNVTSSDNPFKNI